MITRAQFKSGHEFFGIAAKNRFPAMVRASYNLNHEHNPVGLGVRRTAMIAQMIYDTLVKKRPNGIRSKLIIKLASAARSAVLKAGDPLIDYTVGNTPIKMPLSHNLGVYYRNDPLYSVSLASIARIVQAKYPKLTFIDVGANIGDTIPLLRSQAQFPILAIEGDPTFFSTLQLNSAKFTDITNVKCFLGDADPREGELSFVSGSGTGRFEKGGAAGAGSSKIVRLDELLKNHPAFYSSKMIKIDTDGFDAKVIRGALSWLKDTKPVAFFEYAPHYWEKQGEDCISTFQLLKDAGYSKLIVFRASGEYLCSARLEDQAFIEELKAMHKRHFFYSDICAFSEEDLDLFEKVRSHELAQLVAHGRW